MFITIGTSDDIVPYSTILHFQDKVMQADSSTCTVQAWQNLGHGFANFDTASGAVNSGYNAVVEAADAFLVAQGFLIAP